MMTQPAAVFRTFFNFLNRLEELFLCLLLLTMIGLACTQIILRDLFSTGFVWADPLLRYMVIWAGLFGADIATRKKKHIRRPLLGDEPRLSGGLRPDQPSFSHTFWHGTPDDCRKTGNYG
jgi:hypothetical protein